MHEEIYYYTEKMKAQIVRYKCCGKVFAACMEPSCYTEREWLKDLKKYIKAGRKVETVESTTFQFGKCECIKHEATLAPAPDLFSEIMPEKE